MIIVVSGSRHCKDAALVMNTILAAQRSQVPPIVPMLNRLYVGDCPTGADAFADAFARAQKWELCAFKAHWDRYGKVAGPMRTDRMIAEASLHAHDHGQPIVGVAIFKAGQLCKGTKHAIEQMLDSAITVLVAREE